jgi:hypothetical protein
LWLIAPAANAKQNCDSNESAYNSKTVPVCSTGRSRQALTFQEFSTGLPSTGSFNCVEIGDFNNDTHYDLIFSAEDNDAISGPTTYGLWAYTGNGGINWTNTSTGLWRGNSWAGVTLADADSDGYMEFYATDESHGTSNSSGVKAWEYGNNQWTRSSTNVTSPLNAGTPFGVMLLNISGDDKLDMVIANGSGMKYFENAGGNPVSWSDRSTGLPTTWMCTALDVADMNKDGLKDIVFSDYNSGGNEHLYIQNRTGGFHWTSYSTNLNGPGAILGIEVEDVNNDSHMDIVFGCRGDGIYTLLGNSGNTSGTSFTWTAANSGLPTNQHYYDLKVVDIDLDSDMDIVAPSYSNIGIRIYLGNGNTNPGTGMTWTLASNTNLTQTGRYIGVDCKDINKDGSIDIAATSWGSGVHVWLNNLTADIIGPDTILDLTVKEATTNSILVNWTAPADNATNSSSGSVMNYDIRYSNITIDLGSWASAIQCDSEPTPALPGTVQEYNITGLLSGTKYYIAMRSVDERPNYSPLSNVVYDTTLGIPDIISPAQIKDLQAISPTNNSINLTWTAPADNGSNASTGPVSGYVIRYHSVDVINSTWSVATEFPNSMTPAATGLQENITVTRLTPQTVYYFAIKAFDENLNTGWISNSAINTTLISPDIIPPAAVNDLTAIEPQEDAINLTWTAVGDDGTNGSASNYDIRYDTNPITDITWTSALQCFGEPVPQSAGNIEQFQVVNLEPDTQYYFAIKVSDEASHLSALSNIATNRTLSVSFPDSIPPAAISDLTAIQPFMNSLNLTWTAVGDDGMAGQATTYDLRYGDVPISGSNWDFITKITTLPAPKSAGETESLTVSGLESNTTYYFAIMVADEVPNWSTISNIASGTTLSSVIPEMKVMIELDNTQLTALETTFMTITVSSQIDLSPISEALVEVFANNQNLEITPASSLTNPEGKLTVVIKAPDVTENLMIRLFVNVSKHGFSPNNQELTITVQPDSVPPREFNLQITADNISLSQQEIFVGNTITISAKIINTGPLWSESFSVIINIDGNQTGPTYSSDGLLDGEEFIVKLNWTATSGDHNIEVIIINDSPGYESIITDNSAEKDFSVIEKSTDGDGDKKSNNLTIVILAIIILIIIITILVIFFMFRRKKQASIAQMDHRVQTGIASSEEQIQTTETGLEEPAVMEPQEQTLAATTSEEMTTQDGVVQISEGLIQEPLITPESTATTEPSEQPLDGHTELENYESAESSLPDPQISPGALPENEPEPESESVQEIEMVPCPICQNNIPVNMTPCPQCGTTLNWS